MMVSVVAWMVLALGAGYVLGAAQLETGVMAMLYYPPAPQQRRATSSMQPPTPPTPHGHYTRRAYRAPRAPRAHRTPRLRRSYFDRDEDGSREGNDALLDRLRANMTDPDWMPQVGPRAASAFARRDAFSVQP
ncbi:unnamed protein product [Chrysodeixis includens]|uniref:Uncharacterized protein n=1 Tax=Chrysodeixis includens TaxID=689277 RepID=A0A9N8PZ41_CHRIL|nr:unnamed protein product [Chrysodeixis includens]